MTRRGAAAVVLVVAGLVALPHGPLASVDHSSPTSAVRLAAGPGPRMTPAHAAANRARAARLATLEARVRLERSRVTGVEGVGRDVEDWLTCLTPVGVDESGDRHHAWGFVYDERDGTGIDHRAALTLHRGTGPATWTLLSVSRRAGCESAPSQVGGTADAAKTGVAPSTSVRVASATPSDRSLSRRASTLRRSIDRLERRLRAAEWSLDRFDEWESCLVWLPTTEDGDLDQDMGYRFDTGDGRRFRPAIGVDRTTWDDPDYQLIGFRSTALPFTRTSTECDVDPGESADRVAVAGHAPAVVRPVRRPWIDRVIPGAVADLSDLHDDVGDLQSSVEDFHELDQCMYTVGVSEVGDEDGPSGFDYVAADGSTSRRPALAFDMRGFTLPQLDLAAFPGEEPPQIECNEDAGGQETDE